MRVVKVKKIIRDLKQDGWYLARVRGSHREFKHPTKKGLQPLMVKRVVIFLDFF